MSLITNYGIALSTVILLGQSAGYAQALDTIAINATLGSDSNFENSTLSFGQGNKICPDNSCKIEIENGEIGSSGLLTGSLKVENKSGSSGNFTSFDFYKLFASLNLISSKENSITGEKILYYSGKLDIDNPNSVTQLSYDSQVSLTPNNLTLNGKAIER